MRRLLAALLLLSAPAAADMFQDASNAKFPEVRVQLGIPGCDPVAEFGADPTGVADAATAINSCATRLEHGRRVNVVLPAGTFRVNSALSLDAGQNLSGAGRNATIISVDQAFSPAAAAVVSVASTVTDPGPEVRDLAITFAQPSTQAVRANFQNLGTCTSTEGGTGCKYPPAIKFTTTSARYKVSNVRISKAWTGIQSTTNVVWWLDNIEMSALNIGLDYSEGLDFSHIRGYHFWNFDIAGASPLYTGVMVDGQTYAAVFGSVNGGDLADFDVWRARVKITGGANNAWLDIVGLKLDGHGSSLEITGGGIPGMRITNMYTSGNNTPGMACKVVMNATGTPVSIVNAYFDGAGDDPLLCVQAGSMRVASSTFISNNAGLQKAILQTGGALSLKGNTFSPNTGGGAWTNPYIDVQGGTIQATDNIFPTAGTNVGGINIAADNVGHWLSGNTTGAWKVVRGFTSMLGYYDLGDQPIALTVTPSFATPGDFAASALATTGIYFLRGSWIDFDFNTTFNTNAFTTAGGAFRLTLPLPPPVLLNQSCALGQTDLVTFTTPATCRVTGVGANAVLIFPYPITNAASGFYGVTHVLPSKTGVGVSAGGRYRAR